MVTRRRFLEMAAAFAAMGLFHPAQGLARPSAGECLLLGDGERGGESLFGAAPYAARPGSVKIYLPGRGDIREIPLPFFPHAFAQHPAEPNRVVTFEKWGRHLAEVDIAAGRLIRVTAAGTGRRFFGHGAHSGKYIYASQMDDAHGRGLLSVMDSSSHQVVHEIATQGAFPHDCQWLPGENTLLVVNSRKSARVAAPAENFSSLVWLDAESGTCLKQRFIERAEYGYAHFAQSADGHVVLSGSYENKPEGAQPLLAVMRPDGAVHPLDVAGAAAYRLHGEALSLHLEKQTGRVVATFPNAATIQAWNYRTGKFLGQGAVEEPRGLVYSRELGRLLVSSARAKNVLALDEALAATPLMPGGLGAGSHIHRMEL